MQKIVGLDWEDIQEIQNKTHVWRKVDTTRAGDYGADPIGDGTFRMAPSGDIVGVEERNRRLAR